MRLFRPFCIVKLLYHEALFRIKTTEKVIYLTFDDGPDPVTTIPLINLLANKRIKAVFFCSGRAASEYPDLISSLKTAGHLIGNHGFDHPHGFFTSKQKYLLDIAKASPFTSSKLIRPPYGHLRINQYKELKKHYRIVLWDIMPYDFDRKFGSKRSLLLLKKYLRPGSIIALHDKQESTVMEFIEEFIDSAKEEGYRFDVLK
jgi:peptidoglycan/xylan/chitin deacetylase (PgdA/CDA1 family)